MKVSVSHRLNHEEMCVSRLALITIVIGIKWETLPHRLLDEEMSSSSWETYLIAFLMKKCPWTPIPHFLLMNTASLIL